MITVTELTKRYGGRVAVDRVSFACQPGSVTGFLGPNGAGKSTTLRMLCGLTAPDAGTATFGGTPYARLANPGREVGVLLDASAQHRGRTGRETLLLAARILRVPAHRVTELLAAVGLAGAARQRIAGYSLGMRQRLGLAHALLGDPRVLVLDEPGNGLDPEGIVWLRTLLRDFADRGGTVLLSSHLLREVEAVADQLVVIGEGRIVAAGAQQQLLAGAGTRVTARDPHHLRRMVDAAGLVARASGDGALVVDASADQVGELAARAGLVLRELRPVDSGALEDLFLSLTANGGSTHTTETAQ